MSKPTKKMFLINRDFQFKYAKFALLIGVLSTLLTTLTLLYPLYYFRILRFPNFLPSFFLWCIFASCVFNFLIVFISTVFVTHRIAGPMFAIVRNIRKIQQGNLDVKLRLREEDELKYIMRNFNDLSDYLVKENNKEIAVLECCLAENKDYSTRKDQVLVQQRLTELKKRVIQ